MDSRGQSAPPSHHHQHHHQQPPQRMMLHPHQHHPHQHHGGGGYPPQVNLQQSSSQMMTQNSSPLVQNQSNNHRFPFNTQTPPQKTGLGVSEPGYSGDGSRPSGFGGVDPSLHHKKKRGRPRKYSPDGGGSNIALGLTPTPISPTAPTGGAVGAGQGDSSGTTHSSDHKKHRGRPPSSSKKQLDALGNCGVGFTPHVILVNAGEDIASKVMAFAKEGPRTVCILSANGSICNARLRQSAMSGVADLEGRFDIISLTGSFLFSENSGGQVRTGGLSVSLAGTDGRVLGGSVAGELVAASPVQIIVGSFIADGKKPKYMPSVPHSHMLSFSAPPMATAESPVSQEASSEGSEENGSNHINNRNMGSYGNSNHPIHNMQQMYTSMGWPNSG